MHELSVMSQAVDSIMRVVRENGGIRVHSVTLQVGELTFLAWDQLRFGWEIYTRNVGPPLEGAQLHLEGMGARGSCPACGFSGPLKVVEFPDSHLTTPVLDCPRCGEVLDILEGRDLIIRDIRMDVSEERTGEATHA